MEETEDVFGFAGLWRVESWTEDRRDDEPVDRCWWGGGEGLLERADNGLERCRGRAGRYWDVVDLRVGRNGEALSQIEGMAEGCLERYGV